MSEPPSHRYPWESELKGRLDAGDLQGAFSCARAQWLRLQSLKSEGPQAHAQKVADESSSEELIAATRWTHALAPVWWEPIRRGAISLRRSNETDHHFFQQSHEDDEFRKRFGRRPWWRGNLANALSSYARSFPRENGLMYWTILRAEDRVGLASLSQIDFMHSRAEFSIGIPGKPPPGVAHLASLMVLHFAFFRIRLHKLYSYVYEDNPEAAQATLRLGFKEEGRLRDHFRFEQGYVSVTVFGLTVDQLLANSALVKTIERRLGFKVKVG